MNRFQTWYRALPQAIRTLITINVVVYVIWIFLAPISIIRDFVFNHLALHPAVPGILMKPWQLVTYNFLHLGDFDNPGLSFGSLLHIGFNMLWLYWIGRDHEDLHGPKQLLAIYLLTGLGGGLLSVALYPLAPGIVGGTIHGASASVIGVITVVAVTYPHKKIGLFIIGTVRILYLLIAFLVIDLLFLSSGGTAVAAHFGGALFGFLFVTLENKGVNLTDWTRIFFRERRRNRRPVRVPDDASFLERMEAWLASRGGPERENRPRKSATIKKMRSRRGAEPKEESLEHSVDRILDKISEHGIEALTEEERRILDEASKR